MKRISASRLALLDACAWPWLSDLPWDDGDSPYSRFGSAFHKYAEHSAQSMPVTTSQLQAEYRLAPYQVRKLEMSMSHFDLWFDANIKDKDSQRYEIAYAYEPSSGKIVEAQLPAERDYSVFSDHSICGTADLVDTANHIVTDYKTSFSVTYDKYRHQLEFLAMAVGGKYGVQSVTARALKVSEVGTETHQKQLDVIDLDATRLALDGMFAKVHGTNAERQTEPTPGIEQCRFCPCRAACPAAIIQPKAPAKKRALRVAA